MTCATCRYFRKSVIGPVGFCGLDRARPILSGDEVRPCWQAPMDVADLVSDRPGSRRTSWLTLAERQRGGTGAPVASVPVEPGAAQAPRAPLRFGPRDRPLPSIEVHDGDDLVEAPLVPPARRLTSEAQRRAQARRDRQRSADREGAREGIDPPADG